MRSSLCFVALASAVVACAPESPCADGAVCGRVVDGGNARVAEEDDALDVAIFWDHDDIYARVQYAPMVVASVSTNVPVDFSGALPAAPPDDGLIQIQDPDKDVGVVTDPSAPFVGVGRVYVTAAGAVEENPEGVNSLDVDLVLGMSRDATLFYTPVDLETTAGIPGLWRIDDQPISAGYHLYLGGDEVDLTTPIEAELGYVTE